MIQINKKEIIAYYKNKKAIQAIYKGTHLIWQAIRSCFGSGAWFNEKPWIDEEGWKNN
jgi:intein-encoded DNA endonuclease-like protein